MSVAGKAGWPGMGVVGVLMLGGLVRAEVVLTTLDGLGADSPLARDSSYSGDEMRGTGSPTSSSVNRMEIRSDDPYTLRNRIGIIRFDIREVWGTYAGAKLRFFETGKNSRVVSVYGLVDGDEGETWDEATITYNTAPGISYSEDPYPNTIFDPERVVLLGTFATTATVNETLYFEGPELEAFLAADTNGLVTFYLYYSVALSGYTSSGEVIVRTKETAIANNNPNQAPGIIFPYARLGPPPLLGDTNDDGVVDLADYNNVVNNLGASGGGLLGDTNLDGVVDLADYNNVVNNLGATLGAGLAVPEPVGAGVLLSAGVLAGGRRMRRGCV